MSPGSMIKSSARADLIDQSFRLTRLSEFSFENLAFLMDGNFHQRRLRSGNTRPRVPWSDQRDSPDTRHMALRNQGDHTSPSVDSGLFTLYLYLVICCHVWLYLFPEKWQVQTYYVFLKAPLARTAQKRAGDVGVDAVGFPG